ncbi:MAG: L,D-transpeptidase [Bacteroidota bacterium]
MRLFLLLVLTGLLAVPAQAQFGYIDQDVLSRLADNQVAPLDSVPVARYKYYVVKETTRLDARNNLYRRIGHSRRRDEGRKELVKMLNRNTPPVERLYPGDTLIVPLEWNLDLRAYSPFPRMYAGGLDFDKLFVIDKTLQVFAAYEYGQLARWGVISTGDPENPTPNGRFNFNWRSKERVSSLSPPGQEWRMHWVFNFHERRGIHVHQYPLPVDGPVSHGCVRMLNADAKWTYDWADGWTRKGTRIVEQGTTVIIVGTESSTVEPFLMDGPEPVLKTVELPEHPFDIAPGTPQQERFDGLRGTR